jgi:hypothetical protein
MSHRSGDTEDSTILDLAVVVHGTRVVLDHAAARRPGTYASRELTSRSLSFHSAVLLLSHFNKSCA